MWGAITTLTSEVVSQVKEAVNEIENELDEAINEESEKSDGDEGDSRMEILSGEASATGGEQADNGVPKTSGENKGDSGLQTSSTEKIPSPDPGKFKRLLLYTLYCWYLVSCGVVHQIVLVSFYHFMSHH